MTTAADTGAAAANGTGPATVTTAAAPPASTTPAVPPAPVPGGAPNESEQPAPDCVWCDRLPALVIVGGAVVGLAIAYDLWSGGKLTAAIGALFGGLRPPAEGDGEPPPAEG